MQRLTCKGDWGTRLQENPQLILQFVIMIQLTSRRILKDQDEAPEGMFYTIYWVCILSVRVSVIGAILVCLSITLVILEQAQAAPEYRFAVQGWRQSYPLTESSQNFQTKEWTELVEQYLTKILSQDISRIPGSINVVWLDFVILYYISDIVIVREPLTRHSGARSSPPERPRSRSNITT